MPVYRFSTAFRIARGVKAFISLGGGVTRGEVPDTDQKTQTQKLMNAETRIEKLRQRLEHKSQEVHRLKSELSARGGPRQSKLKEREATAFRSSETDVGALPDFVIIGGKKCGTTFLYHLLRQHPHVIPAAKKEVHFFDMRFHKGVKWYRSQFPTLERGQEPTIITGEASPYYLYHPHAAKRASEVVPHVKLIALLRDPIDRAFSDYHDKSRQGREPLTFEEAIEAEESRLRGEKEKMLADETYVSRNDRAFSYLSRGIYVDQLREWHKFFGEEQILVLKSEDMFSNITGTLKKVSNFLCLSDLSIDVPPRSENRNEGQYAPMKPATRESLRDYFAPHNQRLYEYLDTDFGW